jgi:hypothetical protein
MDRIIFLIFTIMTPSFAVSKSSFLLLKNDNKYHRINIERVGGIRVSSNCRKFKKCLNLLNRKFVQKTSSGPEGFIKSLSSEICKKQLYGKSIILSDIYLNQYSFCKFKTEYYLSIEDILNKTKIN